ncbi:hypothetical protein EST38_g2953 [Candolleomyces aberdarensis]|uniref:chitin deacetylase n=1 Tax=Candolleomyces aberdarensis TaxID=2316362 RepID=A0A4Q2DVF8_9AGAR|nr:hypothetical protein EST38_g2953 [Candolleomyces aberdarensis]
MKSLIPSVVAVLTPVAFVVGQNAGEHHSPLRRAQHHARQDAPSASTSTSPVALPTSSVSGASGTVSVAPTSTVDTAVYTFSLAATNPTAVPLSIITANQASSPTLPLSSTPAAGASPTFISGAPSLPNVSTIQPTNYPTMDRIPPLDSAEVQQWKQDVANSGISIPDFQPTNPGGCVNNTAIATDPARCWWSCTGCVTDKDITQCPDKNSWGLTYDDGPGYYTPNLLQYLDEKDLKSTFFVVGSRAIQFPSLLQAEYLGQHQIAVHTWSHQPLTQLTNDEIIAELGWTKKVIKDILGITPNMMRPPFGDIDNRVRAISLAMGMTPVIWTRTSATSTFDTDGEFPSASSLRLCSPFFITADFNIHSGVTPVQKVLQNWQTILASASTLDHGFIVLEHDLFQESVEVATGYILPDALAHNPPFKIQPVVSCLGMQIGDAYIETNKTTAGGSSASTSAGDATKSNNSIRQSPFESLVATTLIVGVSGFALGFFALTRF